MAQAITPNRTTQLRLPVADRVQLRTPFEIHRKASEIVIPRDLSVINLLSKSKPTQRIGAARYGASGLLYINRAQMIDSEGIRTSSEVTNYNSTNTTMATNWASQQTFRKPTDLPGVSYSSDISSGGLYQFVRRVPATGTYNSSLEPLNAAPNYPNLIGNSLQTDIDCALRSTSSLPANQQYKVGWSFLNTSAPDVICAFYFGGNVPTRATTLTFNPTAGRFGLVILGSGDAKLIELVNGTWVLRGTYVWNTRGQQASVGLVQGYCNIIPLSPDAIVLQFGSLYIKDTPNFGTGIAARLVIIAETTIEYSNIKQAQYTYQNIPALTGFNKTLYSTGTGSWELHVRRDLRGPFDVNAFNFKEESYVLDEPFICTDVLTTSDVITLTAQGFLTPSGSGSPGVSDSTIDFDMYTADGTPLSVASSTSVSKSFYGVNNVRAYRVGITLNPSSDHQQTPVLYGYTVTYAGSYQNRSATPSLLSPIDVALEGPGMTMNEDACRLEVADPLGSFPGLHTRANHRAQVNVYRTDTGALRSVLFEGMNVGTPSKPMAKTGRTYPGANFYRYSVDLAGMWQRLEGKILRAPINFSVDPTASRDSRGVQPSQKVTTAISKLLELAGFDTYVIPDIPLRIWGGDQANLFLPGGTRIATALQQLVGTYFNGVLTWCPNTGSAGAWRLILPPVYVYGTATQLATFTTVSGASKIGMFTAENATTGEIVDESLIITPRGPEFNALDVYGQSGVNVFWRNTDSFDFFSGSADPTSIDYVGEIKPFIYYDPAISAPNPADAQAQANWIAYQLIRIGGHGYYEYKWEAPLLLLSPAQTLDPYQTLDRPLRVGDVVLVDSTPVIIRSVNARLNSDQHHMAAYEGVSLY